MTNNLFLLVFDDATNKRQRVLDFLKGRSEIADFHASTPSNLVVVVSPLTLIALRDLLNKEGGMNFFLLVQTSSDQASKTLDGWLPKATWEFIQEKGKLEVLTAPAPAPTPTNAAVVG